jgi:flagellar hook-associated protein 3
MRITGKMTSDNAVFNINANRQRIERLNEVISSGKNVGKPSDSPVAASKIMSLESQSKTVDQYISNIKTGQLWSQMQTTVLEGLQKSILEIRGIAGAAVGGLDDPYKRAEALNSLKLYRDQLIDLPNSAQIGDQYIFSGYKGTTRPFEQTTITADSTSGSNVLANIDTTNLHPGIPVRGTGIPANTFVTAITGPNSVTLSNSATASTTGGDITFSGVFTGTDDAFDIEISQGLQMTINTTGGKLLRGATPGDVDIIKIIDQLTVDIANANQAGVIAANSELEKANRQIMSVVSDVGMRVSRLDNALSFQERSNNVLKQLLANINEVDMAKAAAELTNQKTAFEATLAATAKITSISLLDYL